MRERDSSKLNVSVEKDKVLKFSLSGASEIGFGVRKLREATDFK